MQSQIAGATVLFVEDFAPVADTGRCLLEDLGCRVILARNLAEAQAAVGQRLDVAVVDASLPDGHGTELIAPLRAKPGHVGIVMMSGGYDGRGPGEDDARIGHIEYLAKPFLRADLERAVSAVMHPSGC